MKLELANNMRNLEEMNNFLRTNMEKNDLIKVGKLGSVKITFHIEVNGKAKTFQVTRNALAKHAIKLAKEEVKSNSSGVKGRFKIFKDQLDEITEKADLKLGSKKNSFGRKFVTILNLFYNRSKKIESMLKKLPEKNLTSSSSADSPVIEETKKKKSTKKEKSPVETGKKKSDAVLGSEKGKKTPTEPAKSKSSESMQEKTLSGSVSSESSSLKKKPKSTSTKAEHSPQKMEVQTASPDVSPAFSPTDKQKEDLRSLFTKKCPENDLNIDGFMVYAESIDSKDKWNNVVANLKTCDDCKFVRGEEETNRELFERLTHPPKKLYGKFLKFIS